MHIEIVNPESVPLAVSLQDFKLHARITGNEQDDMILMYLASAEDFIRRRRHIQLSQATIIIHLDDMDRTKTELILPIAPIVSCEDWTIQGGQVPRIKGDFSGVESIEVVAGYETTPASLKGAICLLAAHYHENRESVSVVNLNKIPMGVDDIINHYGWSQ